MPNLPREFIDAVLDRTDIVDIVSSYVSLKRAGNKYVGLCPFHNEKTPSFTVDGQKQLYYCFGCHTGGNAVTFLAKKENLSFVEVITDFAKRANMEIPEMTGKVEFSVSREQRTKILEANKDAARYYFNMLYEPEGTEGLEYLLSRGLNDSVIKRFGLGYAPDMRDGLIKHLMSKGYDEQTIVDAGLARKNEFGVRDNFRTRVMFPIISVSGDVLGFGGRVMDKSLPKYLNTGDTPVFNKRKNLYALNILKKGNKGIAIIGEGYMDVIALNMAGFDYGVASLGTAVTPEQVHLLKRYAKEIYVCYDGDRAGIDATHKVIDLMKTEELKPKIIELPLGVDPDEFIKANGADTFKEMMKKARTSIEYLTDEVMSECDMTDEAGRAVFAQKATQIVKKYAFDAIETEMYLKRISALSGFSMDSLYGNYGSAPDDKPIERVAAYGIQKKFESATERALIAVLVEHPELLPYASNHIADELFVNNAYCRIYKKLCELNARTSINELLRYFEEDEECQSALSAVGIEMTVFGDEASFLKDCCIKMNTMYLTGKRDTLMQRLREQIPLEEKMNVAQEVSEINKRMNELNKQF